MSLTITKPLIPSIWGRLHEPRENYAGSSTWISFLHSFASRPLVTISCLITSIHVFFGLYFTLLTCFKLISSTRRTGASVGLHCAWPNHHRRFSLIFSYMDHSYLSKNILISHVISRVTTHPTKHVHLCYSHLLGIISLYSPTFHVI